MIPDLSDYSDPEIHQHLSDPAKFRQTFPEYSHLEDGEIADGMQKTALRNPQYGRLPSVQPPTPSDSFTTGKMDVKGSQGVDTITGIPEDNPLAVFGTRVGAKLSEDVPLSSRVRLRNSASAQRRARLLGDTINKFDHNYL